MVKKVFNKKKKNQSKKKQFESHVIEPSKQYDKEEEPSWYHYLIVLLIFALIIGSIYFPFGFLDKPNEPTGTAKKFPYEYKVKNITYNIEFNNPIDQIESSNIYIQPNKLDVLNTIEFIFSLDKYNGTDNGYVAISATKIANLFKVVYKFSYDANKNFKQFNSFNCQNATTKNKVITFNPYSNENAVYFTNNSCIEVNAKSAKDMLLVSDAFIYSMIKN